jgi:hypothetical protein
MPTEISGLLNKARNVAVSCQTVTLYSRVPALLPQVYRRFNPLTMEITGRVTHKELPLRVSSIWNN